MKSVKKADKSYLLLFMRSLDGLLPKSTTGNAE
jgi:hypothetical protein